MHMEMKILMGKEENSVILSSSSMPPCPCMENDGFWKMIFWRGEVEGGRRRKEEIQRKENEEC